MAVASSGASEVAFAEQPRAGSLDFEALGLNLVRDVIRPAELEAVIVEARRLGAEFSRGQDSVDKQPSFELQLVDGGDWKPSAGGLQQILSRPIDELLGKIADIKGEGAKDLMVFQSWIRRYAPGERRDHPLHFDHHSKVTAVCSLTPPKAGSGLYVQPGAHVDTREFLDLGTAGTFAVHGWDLAHGVDVRGDEERFSLILFLKPAADVASGGTSWYQPLADAGNVQASYRLGMDFEAAHDVAQAKVYYQRAAEGGSWTSMHRLGAILLREGNAEGARPLLESAAAAGYASAQVALGDLQSSNTVPPAGSSAAELYEAAAAQRHPGGQHRAALVRLQAGDAAGGEQLLMKAADRGWADAQVALARRLAARGGEDRQAAWTWYSRAAEQGHPAAFNQLAVLAAEAGDLAASRRNLHEAAWRGSRAAMANLALYFEKGIGGEQDLAAAAEWRQKANQQ